MSKFLNCFDKILQFVFLKVLRIRVLEKNWAGFVQFIKFGMVGLSNTLISYISYLLFIYMGCHYLISSILSFVVSVTNSYYWNNKYVFRAEIGENRVWWRTYVKTFMAYASTGLVLNNILLVFWVSILHVGEIIAPLINLIVTVPLNYLVNKYWAFKRKE